MEPEENIDASKKTKENAKKKTVKQTKSDKEFVKNTVEINPDLEEQKRGTAVIGFGRMNPITIGHEKLVDKIKSIARSEGAKPLLYLSHSQDKKKNPLSYGDKVSLARTAFGSMVQTSKSKTLIDVLKELQSKYENIIFVAGSDRIKEFNDLLQKYNGKDYNFASIKVVSAGDRDPDSDDVSGMSASKMRAIAAAGKEDEFKRGLPKKLQGSSQEIYNMVRAGMQLAEELEAEGLLIEAPLTIAQRLKRGRIMRRYAAKIRAARRRKARRKASLDVLKRRARKRAINIVRKKVAGARGKEYRDMTAGEKIAIDAKVQKRQTMIDRIARKLIPKVRKIETARLQGKRADVNEEFEALLENTRVAQDPDVKHMPGSQPKGYYKGVKPSLKDDRARHFKKYAKKSDDDPASYKPAPGDKGAKTRESEHTKKFKQMYGEQINIINDDKPKKKTFHQMMTVDGSPKLDRRFKINRKEFKQTEAVDPRVARLKDQHTDEKNRLRRAHELELDRLKTNVIRSKTSSGNKPISEDADLLRLVDEIHESLLLDESKVKTALQNKAKKSGISYGILKKVYDRGVAAWRTGHRPGTTPSQWGMARVNSFATKSKGTWGKADSDLAAKVRNEEVQLDEVSKDDANAIHNMLNSQKAETLLKLYKKLYKREYPGTSKSELVSKIKSKARSYKHIYGLMQEETSIDTAFETFMEDKGSMKHHLGIGVTAKHMKQHAMMHIDKDVDGDVDEFDKNTPDEITGAEKTNQTAKMLKKYAGEKEQAKKHIAFESVDEAFENFLNEGVNDPAIFKAVFLAGGPGSGKSFIVGKTALPALGFKVINSDQAFEVALAKAGMAATPENIYSPQGQEIRAGAKALTKKKLELALAGRLGLVIDGTGKDYDKITKQAINLRKLGYDVAMIFVNTDENTALERNRKRSRSLPDDTVSKMWKDVQKNLGAFQTFFGNFFLVDNSEGSDFNKQSTDVYRKLMTWSKQKPRNKAVTDWMKAQTQKEEHGAGFRGTSDLADRYANDTPGQEPMKTHKNKYKEPKAIKINENFEDLFKEKDE